MLYFSHVHACALCFAFSLSAFTNNIWFKHIADHHGPPKVNFWQDPLSPSKWKEEHVSPFLFWNFLQCVLFL